MDTGAVCCPWRLCPCSGQITRVAEDCINLGTSIYNEYSVSRQVLDVQKDAIRE